MKRTGDGALVEFRSVVDAVRCAIEVQNGMVERNAGLPPERRIEFRIGIHLGDVVEEHDGDLMGDGVNIASRLEGVAEPGGISLSAADYEQVRDKVKEMFIDLGEKELKNIARPVRVFRIDLKVPITRASESARPALTLPDKPSIAVLPFQNMSGDSEQDYFCDGTVEEIITGLSRIRWLFVIARNSSFVYKGRAVDVKQVGRELGVRYVLEGSVRKVANRVRITSQLIEAQTGSHLWAERYDRPFDDIFALQDEITLAVVGAIEPNLRQAEINRVIRKRPESLDAYDLVLQMIPRVSTLMPDGAGEALPYLKRALAIEPDYALAHGLAAWAHHILFHRAGRKAEERLSSINHAHQAIAFGRGDAMALTLGGFVISMDAHDRVATREAFDAALAISPSSAFTYFQGGVALAYAGEAERAIEWGERALRLSPYDELAYFGWHAMCLGHFKLEQYAKAANLERRAAQAKPGFSVFQLGLAASLAKSGQIDAAREAAARLLVLEPQFSISGFCAALGIPTSLSIPLSDALRAAGLPE